MPVTWLPVKNCRTESGRGYDFDYSLNNAVKKLRQALGDEAEKPVL